MASLGTISYLHKHMIIHKKIVAEIKPLFKDLSSSNCTVWATFFSQLFSSLWVSKNSEEKKTKMGWVTFLL